MYKFCMSLTTTNGLEIIVDGKHLGSDLTGLEHTESSNTVRPNVMKCGRPTKEVTHFGYSEVTVGSMDVFYTGISELVEENNLVKGKHWNNLSLTIY